MNVLCEIHEYLCAQADSIFESNTVDGAWDDEAAREEHDGLRRLADLLMSSMLTLGITSVGRMTA